MVDMTNTSEIRTIDDGAPQYDPRTQYAIRTWVEEDRTEQQDDNLVTYTARVAQYTIEPIPASPERVNAERDRRMATFVFAGKAYDLEGQSLANVSGVGTLSLAAIINGAQPGDLRWADPDQDFTWIANDNTIVPMDAQTTWAFAQTAAAWRKHCIYKARAIKDMNPIPSDYTDDKYWI